MNREIKFRSWSVHHNKMNDLKKITPLALDPDLKMDGLFLPFEDGIILMQYAGLKDKNGKEIYEGDITKDGGRVIWAEDYAAFHVDYPGVEVQDLIDSENWLEIIGNIYENPDLLK